MLSHKRTQGFSSLICRALESFVVRRASGGPPSAPALSTGPR